MLVCVSYFVHLHYGIKEHENHHLCRHGHVVLCFICPNFISFMTLWKNSLYACIIQQDHHQRILVLHSHFFAWKLKMQCCGTRKYYNFHKTCFINFTTCISLLNAHYLIYFLNIKLISYKLCCFAVSEYTFILAFLYGE